MHTPLVSRFIALILVLATTGLAIAQFGGDPFGNDPFGAPSEPVTATAEPNATTVKPGGRLVLAFVLEHGQGYHSWPARELDVLPADIQEFAQNTSVSLKEVPSWISTVGPVQWPDTHIAKVANPSGGPALDLPTFDGRAVSFLPLIVGEDVEPGTYEVTLAAHYQACDDKQCLFPESPEYTFEITVDPSAPDAAFAGTFAEFDAGVYDTLTVGEIVEIDTDVPVGSSFFGFRIGAISGVGGFLLLAALGIAGGFILNLTPCVLPVIPIKIMTLSQHAGSPGKSFVLGVWMALGVIAFWVAIGIPAAFVARFADPSIMFGVWWVTGGIGLIIAVMALGLMGLFSITLPQKVYMVNPEADSPSGSFMFGIMTAVLGLPCFGFVAGALLPAAASFGPWVTMIVFGCMGVGMAAPYFILSANPKWVDKIPRTGPASELVKQVMGLLLLAAAAYFIGAAVLALIATHPYIGPKLHYWVIALFGVLAGGLLLVRTFQITKKPAPRVVFGAAGLFIAVVSGWIVVDVTESARRDAMWVAYSDDVVESAKGEGKVIVMDFTAEWCINCKALKSRVLYSGTVWPLLEGEDVEIVRVDFTGTNAEGQAMLRSFGQIGIPTLVIMGPANEYRPWIENAYTPSQVVAALREAGVRGSDALASSQ